MKVTYAVGRLSRMQDGSGSTDYCYDRFGDLVRKVQTTNGKVFVLRYAYTKTGQLSRLTYPDGAAVDYVRNAQGQTTEVGVTPAGGTRQVLLGNATYYPFGPVASWSYGNGRPMQRVLDQDYRPLAINDTRSDGLSTGFAFDPAGNLSALTAAGNTAPVVSLDYDALGRLTAFKDGPTGTVIDGYSYDATGNRLSAKVNTTTQSYTYPTTNHRLSTVAGTARTYDAIGNTLSIGGTAQQFVYDARGRMSQAKRAGVVTMQYGYNGRGEQVRRVDKTNTYTLYDESGHWLGNYDANGASLQQAIWLDDLPVGVLAKNSLRYVQPDHLGTPRAVVDPVRDVAIWTWDLKGEAFGNTPPDQDPDKDGTAFVFDMRFPGQRYDAAMEFNQNYFRDYEPGTGRYGQSDPIGLGGGISTYAYIGSRPLASIDPMGLSCKSVGGITRCDYPGGPSFNLPTPPGWQDFDGSEWMYHHYDARRKIGCANANGVMQDLINHPTPSPNARPATSGGTKRNDAGVPYLPVSNFVTTYLTTDLRTGGSLVVNITAPGSFFDPGYVARAVANGVAHTYGEGASIVQHDKSSTGGMVNWAVNELVWGDQMQRFIDENSPSCGCP